MSKNFLGIPVEGEITAGRTHQDQKPIEDLAPIIQAVLDDPTIVEFGWRQYTPYFNDGEPCEFSVYGTWFRTPDEPMGTTWYHPSLGRKDWRTGEYTGPDEARYDRCAALTRALESGSFDNVLLEAFGDHAQVTVRRDGITVEFYHHD